MCSGVVLQTSARGVEQVRAGDTVTEGRGTQEAQEFPVTGVSVSLQTLHN